MPYEFVPIVFGLTLLFGILVFVLIKKYLDDKNRMRLRELAHQERMKALEKEVPLMEVNHDSALTLQGEPGSAGRTGLVWLRLTALCIGLGSFFGGIGMCVAFLLAWDPEMRKIWPVGLIPAMIGFGLLLFYVLSRQALAEAGDRSGQ